MRQGGWRGRILSWGRGRILSWERRRGWWSAMWLVWGRWRVVTVRIVGLALAVLV